VLVNNDLVQEYAMLYCDENRSKLSGFDSWFELYRYLQKQPLLENLVSYADYKGIRRRPYYIEESRQLLESQLYAYIIRTFWGEEGFYSVLLEKDNVVKKAIELITSGKASPEAVANRLYELSH
jgi:carboxyl-terminal processing protease